MKPVIDYLGFVVLGTAVTCIVLVTTWGGQEYAWSSPTIIGLAVAAVVLLALFVVLERRAAEPVIPPRLFRSRAFTVAAVVSFIIGIAMFGAIQYLALFLQVVLGVSATKSGLMMLPLMAGLLGASIASGRAISRTGKYRIYPMAGTLIATLAMILLSRLTAHSGRLEPSLFMIVLGVGIGLVMQTMVLVSQNSAELRDLGVATSTANFCRSMGASIGIAMFGSVFNTQLRHHLARAFGDVAAGARPDTRNLQAIHSLPQHAQELYKTAFADSLSRVFEIAAPVVFIGFLMVLFMPELPLRGIASKAKPAGTDAGGASASSGALATGGATATPVSDQAVTAQAIKETPAATQAAPVAVVPAQAMSVEATVESAAAAVAVARTTGPAAVAPAESPAPPATAAGAAPGQATGTPTSAAGQPARRWQPEGSMVMDESEGRPAGWTEQEVGALVNEARRLARADALSTLRRAYEAQLLDLASDHTPAAGPSGNGNRVGSGSGTAGTVAEAPNGVSASHRTS
jgi:hypothetical protein